MHRRRGDRRRVRLGLEVFVGIRLFIGGGEGWIRIGTALQEQLDNESALVALN